jgi:hypothetical protein
MHMIVRTRRTLRSVNMMDLSSGTRATVEQASSILPLAPVMPMAGGSQDLTEEKGRVMCKATKLLFSAAIALGVVAGLCASLLPWGARPDPAMGDDVVSTMPSEAVGLSGTLTGQVAKYDLAFSTFFGKKMDCRGMTVDARGNVYLAGSTWDGECPTTEGAYDRTFHGEADMALSKWSPEGRLLWSALVGSAGHDRPYSVKVDSRGCVYAAGIGGAGMPVSPDAFQPKPLARTKNAKIPGEEYVGANGYIVKLSADGS